MTRELNGDDTLRSHVELSVVMPAYNAGATIGAQLDALLRQDWLDSWEIVVADNGSTDETRQIVAKFCEQDRRVRIIDASQRTGPSHARNEGVANARGAMIAFCDADDVVAPGWVAAVTTVLRRSPAVTGPLELSQLNPAWLQNAYGSKLATEPQAFASTFPFGPTANLGVRRNVFMELGGFDPTLPVGEDIEFCLRLWSSGRTLEFAPAAVVHYRLRSTPSALWRQSFQYGAATPLIVKLLNHQGHRVTGSLRGGRKWLWLLKALPSLRTQQGRARWIVVLGGALGRIVGSMRHRTLHI